ncbi:unnamed protein product [Discula destructiva]
MTSLATTTTRRLLTSRRCRHRPQLGTRTLATAAEAAEQMMQAFQGQAKTLRQTLDSHHLQKLSLTLNRPHLHPALDVTAAPPPAGTPLPPGYHLVYFLPAAVEAALALDGTDRTFNAAAPFTRRMWAGGRMRWTAGCPLRVGEEVEERTRLVGATAKRSRGGGEMVLVEVEKEFWGPAGLALVDRRSWVFRPPAATERVAGVACGAVGKCSSVEDVEVDGSGVSQRRFCWSPVALFRFSALTFNAHMIHYNESWTRDVEGHPAVVVHGPLNLIGMMDYWRDVHGHGKEAAEIRYRALSPLYTGDQYTVQTESVEGNTWEVAVTKGDRLCMRGTISSTA